MADAILSGTVAAMPVASTDGQLYLPTDGFQIFRDNGAAWVPWGPVYPCTTPDDSGFAWINQGGASVDSTYGGVHLLAPAGAGTNMRIRKKAAPSTPYTITGLFLLNGHNVNFNKIGLCFRQSSDGKLHAAEIDFNQGIGSIKYTDATTFSATYALWSSPLPQYAPWYIWLRIGDDGVNRNCYWSMNGQHWINFHSIGRTDFLTADEVGWHCNAENATYPAAATLLSWVEA